MGASKKAVVVLIKGNHTSCSLTYKDLVEAMNPAKSQTTFKENCLLVVANCEENVNKLKKLKSAGLTADVPKRNQAKMFLCSIRSYLKLQNKDICNIQGGLTFTRKTRSKEYKLVHWITGVHAQDALLREASVHWAFSAQDRVLHSSQTMLWVAWVWAPKETAVRNNFRPAHEDGDTVKRVLQPISEVSFGPQSTKRWAPKEAVVNLVKGNNTSRDLSSKNLAKAVT